MAQKVYKETSNVPPHRGGMLRFGFALGHGPSRSGVKSVSEAETLRGVILGYVRDCIIWKLRKIEPGV